MINPVRFNHKHHDQPIAAYIDNHWHKEVEDLNIYTIQCNFHWHFQLELCKKERKF